MDRHGIYPVVELSKVLVQDKKYIAELEPRQYQKLSVKLYGRGVTIGTPTDGRDVRMKRHQLAQPGQVILSEIWAKKGAIGIVPIEGKGALITSHFFLFDIREDVLLPGFMKWLLQANYFGRRLDMEARGTTGYAAIRPKQFLSMTIPLPPLGEQRRIVARVDALAARIAEAQALRSQALAEAEAVMGAESLEAFEQFAALSPNHLLGNVISFRKDLIRPTDGKTGTIRFIGLQHIESHTGKRIGEDILDAKELKGRKFLFSPGEIVYGYLRPYLNKVWIADCSGICSVDQYVIRPDNRIIDTHYLAYFMRSPGFLAKANELTHNLMLPRLRTKLLESIQIPIPTIQQQHRIVAHLDALQAKVDAVKNLQAATQAELNALLPAVLDRAFKGEL